MENITETAPEITEHKPLETQAVSAESLASEITGSMSDATESQKTATAEHAENATKGMRVEGTDFFDSAGTKFDPEKHRANPLTGTPELTAEKTFKSKKGRKSAGESSYRPAVAPDGTAVAPDEYDHNATLFLGMFYAFSCANISPAWKPGGLVNPSLSAEQQKAEADSENETLRFPLAAYLREKKFKELKPWQMLTLGIASFGFRRYSEDEATKEKFQKISATVREKIFGKKQPNT